MKKFAFFSSDPGCHKFLTPIIEHLQAQGHECDLFTGWTHTDATVLWFDFCDNNLIVASTEDKELLKSKKVIARLHAIEYYMGFHHSIDWTCVSDLIFVSEHMKRLCNKDGELPVRQHVIHNGIDMEKMVFKEREAGFTLGYAGNIVPTKGMIPMLSYISELSRLDPRWNLKMVGFSRMNGREGEFYEYQKSRLPIEESGEVSNIDEWLESVNYLFQPSIAESFSFIIGEAMAKGIKPVINDFYGAKELWPEELIYHDFTSFLEVLNSPYESQKYRQFVEERYSLKDQLTKIDELLK